MLDFLPYSDTTCHEPRVPMQWHGPCNDPMDKNQRDLACMSCISKHGKIKYNREDKRFIWFRVIIYFHEK